MLKLHEEISDAKPFSLLRRKARRSYNRSKERKVKMRQSAQNFVEEPLIHGILKIPMECVALSQSSTLMHVTDVACRENLQAAVEGVEHALLKSEVGVRSCECAIQSVV